MTVQTVTVFETKLRSPRALRDAMKYRRYSLRTLADEATRDLKRQKERGVSHQTLGHLLTGYQKTVRPEVARSLEEILDVPIGSLFETRVSNIQREIARNQRGSLAPGIALLAASIFALLFVGVILAGVGAVQHKLDQLTEQTGQFIGGVL